MKKAALLLALTPLLIVGACAREPAPAPGTAPTRFGGNGTVLERWTYLSGTSGTVIVPAGDYVTAIWAHATSAGSVTITPSGPNALDPCASFDAGPDADALADAQPCQATGNTITIPAGTAFELRQPVLRGSRDELGDGTRLVFTSTDAYFVGLVHYGP